MSHFQKQVQEFLSDSEDLVELARSEYRLDNDDQLPAHEESLCLYLTDYTGEERDLLWWGGRFSLALERDQITPEPIRVPLTESDCHDLLSGETFHWSFNGIPVFLFNTDENPELDPDSDEYDPSVSIF